MSSTTLLQLSPSLVMPISCRSSQVRSLTMLMES